MPFVSSYEPPRRVSTAYFWLFFFGVVGAHHFYLGRRLRGIIYACTFGLFYVGVVYDGLTLAAQVDAANAERSNKRREDEDEPDYAGIDAMIARYRATDDTPATEQRRQPSEAAMPERRSFGRRG